MRASRGAVLAVLLALGAARAEPPKVKGVRTVKEHTPVELSVDASPDPKVAKVAWEVYPFEKVAFVSGLPNGRTAWCAPPGTYTVRVTVIDWEKRQFDVINETVTVEGNAIPDPKPKPPPPDDGKGDATPTKLFVVVVDETATAAESFRGKYLFDRDLAGRFAEKGHVWRVVDKDVRGADGQPPKDVKRFLDAAAGKPYPTYFLVDPAGKVRGSGAVPAKPAELLDAIKKVGG